MAGTKRKRQTKHRGNAAGFVEARGRTGRKPTAEEKDPAKRQAAVVKDRRKREEKPPTWRGSFLKALGMAVILVVFLVVINTKHAAGSVILLPIVLLVYWPLSFYTEQWAYRRRQRSKTAASAKAGRR
jgi:hypothetical protein